jgi:RNA polymerase sigma factor (sigma-70 family)
MRQLRPVGCPPAAVPPDEDRAPPLRADPERGPLSGEEEERRERGVVATRHDGGLRAGPTGGRDVAWNGVQWAARTTFGRRSVVAVRVGRGEDSLEASAAHAPAGIARITARGPLLRLRSDDQLVALFRMGYDEAFDVIHDRYRQRLLAYTRQMLGGARTDAEDVLQDVFLRAYRALRHDDRPVTLRAWLYRVAHNRCVDHLRRPEPPAAEVFELSRAPERDPSDETERREDLRRLVQDMQRLPDQQRSALLMREIDGLSYAELADVLGTTVPAVKSLLVRARIGLVEAGEARDTACAEIRADLDAAHGRGVRASSRSRRHLRDCPGCRDYRSDLRSDRRGHAALSAGGGPLATVAKLLGLGGASSGAAAGAGAGGSAAAIGGASAATATKVVAIVCCAAVVGGGAVEVKDHNKGSAHHRAVHRAAPAAAAPAAATSPRAAAPAVRPVPATRAFGPIGGRPAARPRAHGAARTTHHVAAVQTGGATATLDAGTADPAPAADTTTTVTPTPAEQETGGTLAPDENAPEDAAPPVTQTTDTGPGPADMSPEPPVAAPADTSSEPPNQGDSSGPGPGGDKPPLVPPVGDG